jgi:hypothetical protein
MARPKMPRKNYLTEHLLDPSKIGGSSGSKARYSGQFWTTKDANLLRNLRVAGIAQW